MTINKKGAAKRQSTTGKSRTGGRTVLPASESNFRNSMENSPLGIRIVSEDGETLYANRAFLNIYGYKNLKEFKTTPVKDRYTPDSYIEFCNRREKRRRQEPLPENYEISIVRKNGEVRHLYVIRKEILWGGKQHYQTIYQDITERKQAEAALQASEAQLRAIIDATPFPVALVDEQDNNIYLWSRSARVLFGHTAPTASEWYEIAYPDPDYRRDVIERWKPALEKARLSGQATNTGEYRVTCRDGSVRICELYASFLANYLIVTFNDITERKQAEEALMVSEDKFKYVFDNSAIGKSLTSISGEIHVNMAFCNMLGYSREELANKSWQEITHPDDVELTQKALDSLLSGGKQTARVVKRYFQKNGSIIWTDVQTSLRLDKNGKPLYFMTSITDITERKQAEEALKASEVRYRRLFEAAKDGILIIDAVTGLIVDTNPFLNNLLGLSLKEIKGKELWEIGTFADIVSSKERFEELRQKGYVRYEDLPLKTVDGRQISVEFVSNVYDVDHRKIIQCNIRDITERKHAEEALRQSETYLRATLDSTGDAILVVDNHQNIINTNNNFVEMFNVPHDFIINKDDKPVLAHVVAQMVEPDAFLAKVNQLYASDQIDKDVLHLKDGRIIERYSEPLMLQNKIFGRVWSFRNISEFVKAEEALRTSEERYRLIVEKSNDVIFTFNAAGVFTYVSPSVKNLLGYNPSELIGRTFSSLVHPDDVRRLQEIIRRNIKDGTQTPGGNEYRVRHTSGEWRWHNASGNAVYDTNGKFFSFVAVARDITEHKQITMRLDDLHKTLQLVTDINQLIVKIDNEAELLQQSCNEFVKSRQYPLAWIGFKQEGSYDILPSVMCGERADYLSKIKITWDDSRFSKGPTGVAVKTGKLDVIRDMAHDPRYETWRHEALKNGFKASVAFPLFIQEKVIGALTIYSASAEAFDKDELDLLGQLVGDLSLGIEKIRRREEQLKLEEALKLSEQNFRNSLDSSLMGIRIVDAEWHTLYANHVFLNMFGYKNVNDAGRYSLQDRYTPEEKTRYRRRMEKRQRGESIPDNPKVDIIGKDGTVLSIVVYSSEVIWNGKLQRQLIYHDITERQKAEDALILSEQNFRNSLDSSLFGIRIVDVHGQTLYANQALLDIFGYADFDHIKSNPPQEQFTPEGYQGYAVRKDKRLRGESIPDKVEIDIVRKDGAVRHLQVFPKNVLWNGKQELQIYYQDVTGLKQAEEARKLSEQNFRNSLDSSLIGIRIVDREERNLYLNQTFLNFFGYKDSAEVEASPPQEHYTPESKTAYLRRSQVIAQGGTLPDNYEIDIVSKDGTIRHLQLFRKEVLWDGKQEFQILYNDITERVQAETARQLSEQNFRNSIDSSTMGIRIVGDADYTLYANQALLDMFGYKNIDELRASPPQAHYTPESHHAFVLRHEQFARGEALPDQFEFDIVRKDGAVRHLQLFSKNVLWDGKQQYQILYNDITERVQAEAALKLSEQNFRNSLESSLMGIYISDAEWHVLYVNRAFLNMFGYENIEEVRKSLPHEHLTPAEQQKFLQRQEKSSRGEPVPDNMEMDIIHKDGSIRHLQVFRKDVFWDGKPQRQLIYNDLTERVKAEVALQRSEENFRNTLDTSLVGIFIGDSGNVLYVNRAFLEMFGYDNLDEVRAKRPVELYSPESYARYLERRDRQQRGESNPDNFEIDVVRKDGSIRNLQVFRKEVLWNGQQRSQLLYNDVTALKQAEEERQKIEDKAQVASRLAVVGEMAAGIAHEINNPLTGVLGFSQMMLEKESLPEEIKVELRLIVDGSQRVADIVKRLLTFARQTKPVKTMTNINELIDNTLKLREYVLKTANITLVTRFDPELPWSVVDPGQLQQVFLNLIVNAEQAMKSAHEKGTLTVTTEKKENNIFISFRDDGPGITPENRKRLFEPFFTTKAPGEGTGLGLSLSRSIILEHNGKMDVESEFGRGANFFIELPIIESLPSEVDAQLTPVKTQSVETKHGNILVVDDEPGVRILLERVLSRLGYTVGTVADAEAAVEKLDTGITYDVILTDVRMPGMNGIELHSYILEKIPAMKNRIIFITGDVMGSDIKDFLIKNNLSFFPKPFDIEALKDKINSIILAGFPENGGAERSNT